MKSKQWRIGAMLESFERGLCTTLFFHPTFDQNPFNVCWTNVGQALKRVLSDPQGLPSMHDTPATRLGGTGWFVWVFFMNLFFFSRRSSGEPFQLYFTRRVFPSSASQRADRLHGRERLFCSISILLNSFSPDINMHVLFTGHLIFLRLLVQRMWLNNKAIHF